MAGDLFLNTIQSFAKRATRLVEDNKILEDIKKQSYFEILVSPDTKSFKLDRFSDMDDRLERWTECTRQNHSGL